MPAKAIATLSTERKSPQQVDMLHAFFKLQTAGTLNGKKLQSMEFTFGVFP